ncbi:hypothetical protein MNBD_GAMMA21-851 [hydrothermal vent metagenome]|uniref:ABC3 transporter permease protein domain-containing protein n=1 Tax=hydrothermal vent metagenome TaxID=652676 RepID=A0A3B0ZU73_9ZZZZ
MIYWIFKTLWRQKGSVVSSSTGVAFAFVLVVVMDAAFVGESNQIVAYIRHANPDVWVMQKGVSNMHMATSFVWDWKVKQIEKMPGVKKATPILYVNTVVKSGGRNWFSYIIGLLPDDPRAGPWAMVSGRSQPGPGEIVVPNVLVKMAGVKLGDKAKIADREFTIIGFSADTFSMANSIAFVNFSDLEDLIDSSGTVSFILVDAEAGQDENKLAKRIEQKIDKVSSITNKQFIKNDFQIALLMGVEIVSFMTIVGAVLAALIIAFTAYSQVARRKRELAIAKALGYKNRTIYLAVFFQTLFITSLALVIAFLISVLLLPLLSELIPQITLTVTAGALVRMGVIAFIVATVAALVPARMVANVDPLTAFKV